jgi:hypothetical protein
VLNEATVMHRTKPLPKPLDTHHGTPLAVTTADVGEISTADNGGVQNMQRKHFAIVAGTLALGLAMLIPSRAQGPMFDVVKVNLPYAVTIGDKTIQPGDYMIKELPSQDKSRVLVIYGDNGMKFETTAMTIPAYDALTPDHSEITLHHIGDGYYFDKVWIQGKNYGYQFPLPNNLREREKEQTAAVSVPATYTPPTETAQNIPLPAPQEAAPAPAPEPVPVAAAPVPEPAPQPEIAQNTTPAPAPEVTNNDSADREELPHTSAGWLMMLLSGGSLSGVGLMLRRRS